jgi:hypothetical protein
VDREGHIRLSNLSGVTLAADPWGTGIRPYLLLKSARDTTIMHDVGQA